MLTMLNFASLYNTVSFQLSSSSGFQHLTDEGDKDTTVFDSNPSMFLNKMLQDS